jgi:hypothetical protein
VIVPSDTCWSLFQFMLASWWYCRYASRIIKNDTYYDLYVMAKSSEMLFFVLGQM